MNPILTSLLDIYREIAVMQPVNDVALKRETDSVEFVSNVYICCWDESIAKWMADI